MKTAPVIVCDVCEVYEWPAPTLSTNSPVRGSYPQVVILLFWIVDTPTLTVKVFVVWVVIPIFVLKPGSEGLGYAWTVA